MDEQQMSEVFMKQILGDAYKKPAPSRKEIVSTLITATVLILVASAMLGVALRVFLWAAGLA